VLDDDEEAIEIGNGPEPVYESLEDVRVMPNGRSYWVPDPGRRIIYLEEAWDSRNFATNEGGPEGLVTIQLVGRQTLGVRRSWTTTNMPY
jgi:hypothetical protein